MKISISIHALLAESDYCRRGNCTRCCVFLSTLSLRRATRVLFSNDPISADFYPRSPCGERPYGAIKHVHEKEISIHALLAESDGDIDLTEFNKAVFLSTLSLRRATGIPNQVGTWEVISIHALLAESDTETIRKTQRPYVFLSTLSLRRATFCYAVFCYFVGDFYPRSPCGERRWSNQPATIHT